MLSNQLIFYKYLMITALRVHISLTTRDILEELGGYIIEERGKVEMKVS